MTAITPGTHLVVGEPFTGKIPAGTPFIEVLVTGDVVARLIGWQHDVAPKLPGTSIRHRLTVEAPVPTPDEFQPGTVAWMRVKRDGENEWCDPDGAYIWGDEEVRGYLHSGTARLAHVPTPPAMTRQDAVNALKELGWTSDAIEGAIGAQGGAEVLRGGGEA